MLVSRELRKKFCLQQSKTSLLLAYIEFLWHFSFHILVLYFKFMTNVFILLSPLCFRVSSLLTRAYATPTSFVFLWNATLSWTRVRQKLEITLYKVLNMDIFFLHKRIDYFRRPLLPPRSHVKHFLGWMNAFFGLKNVDTHSQLL